MKIRFSKNEIFIARRELLQSLGTADWVNLAILLGVQYPSTLRDKEQILFMIREEDNK